MLGSCDDGFMLILLKSKGQNVGRKLRDWREELSILCRLGYLLLAKADMLPDVNGGFGGFACVCGMIPH